MGRQLRAGTPSNAYAADSNRQRGRAVSTRHKLLTSSWTADVEIVESAIGGFAAERQLPDDCQVVFFEIAGDSHLHVNVTHQYPTTTARGWAGPAKLPEGFVHNRRFDATLPNQMIRHIREMVFASRT